MDFVAIVKDFAGFGAAGLVAAMWLWERRMSATRDQQLTESHARIQRDEQRLDSLRTVVEQNTQAVARFAEIQREMADVLKHVHEECHHRAVAG